MPIDKICPRCNERYPWYENECRDCKVPLVDLPEEAESQADVDLVSVFRVREAGLLPLAEMALQAESIEFFIRRGPHGIPLVYGEPSFDFSNPVDAVEIVVREPDAERARQVLVDLETSAATAELPAAPVPAPAAGDDGGPVHLVDVDTDAEIGRLTEEQLVQLEDLLEEDESTPNEYFVNQPTIDLLKGSGADAGLIETLRRALGARDGVQMRWWLEENDDDEDGEA